MLTVYKASAGSGKTFTLVYEYIKLLIGRKVGDTYVLLSPAELEKSNRHAHILAITFTNKATAEMKERIIKELNALIAVPEPGKEDSKYAEKYAKDYGWDRQKMRESAQAALRAILNDYGSFNVSTIDSFFQTILRSFAREIDRQGDYRVELNDKMALRQAMIMLLDDITIDPDSETNCEIRAWLNDEGRARMEEGKDFNPFNRKSQMYRSIIDGIAGIFNETFMANEEGMKKIFKDPELIKRFAEAIKKKIDDITEFQKEQSLLMYLKGWNLKYIGPLFEKVAQEGITKSTVDNTLNPKDKENYISRIRKNRDLSSCIRAGSRFVASDDVIDSIISWIESMEASFNERVVFEAIGKRINALKAIRHIYEFLEQFRLDNNLILISDTNSLLKTIIGGSDTPFVYERIGNEITHFLIDEFQDTSRLQWENLKPLVGAAGNDDDSLIIGDVKQSIYRFRGGDPSLLASHVTQVDFPDSLIRGSNPEDNTNRRSARDIVKFNNTLFRDFANLPGKQVRGYEEIAQAVDKDKLDAWICINDFTKDRFAATAEMLLPPEVIEKMRDEGVFEAKDAAEKLAFAVTAQRIRTELDNGYRQRDIAILCAKHDEGGRVAEFLARLFPDLKFMSSELLLLRNSPQVKLIVSMLEIIERSLEAPSGEDLNKIIGQSALFESDSERDKSLKSYKIRRKRAATTDSFEYFVASGEEFAEALEKALEVGESLEKGHAADGAPQDIKDILRAIRNDAPANLVALVQSIIRHKINDVERDKAMPYIASFVDVVDEFMQTSNGSVHSFLQFWQDNNGKLSIAPNERIDAVTISTVHAAKGLEWPCVHIPMLGWDYEEYPQKGWFYLRDSNGNPLVDLGPETDSFLPPIVYLTANKTFGEKGSPLFAQYRAELDEIRLDNLNRAYVAFTRPRRELHVNVISCFKNEGIGDIMLQLIRTNNPAGGDSRFLNLHDFATEFGLEIGQPTVPKKDVEEKDDIIQAPPFAISFDTVHQNYARVSDLLADGSLDIDDSRSDRLEEATEHGKALHSILSLMNTIDDLDHSLRMHRRHFTPEKLDEYRRELQNIFAHADSEALSWFDRQNPRVLNERAILTRSGIVRPDRIVWLPDGTVVVVDYKFVSAAKQSHINQVRDYALAISNIVGHPVKAYLWYPMMNNHIIEVPQ